MLTDNLSRTLNWQIRNQITFAFPLLFKAVVGQRCSPISTCDRLSLLEQRYDLNHWPSACTAEEWQENIYILDLLDQLLGRSSTHQHYLDIGCKYGAYFPALASFTGSGWDGIELDAYRRYWNLASRRDHSRFMAKPFDCRYIPGSLLDLKPPEPYQLITWFLPFIIETPLKAWGLPRRFYQPTALLQHAYDLLAPGGTLLIINQGEWETEVQQRLFTATSIKADFLGQVESEFSPFQQPRFAWRIDKPQ